VIKSADSAGSGTCPQRRGKCGCNYTLSTQASRMRDKYYVSFSYISSQLYNVTFNFNFGFQISPAWSSLHARARSTPWEPSVGRSRASARSPEVFDGGCLSPSPVELGLVNRAHHLVDALPQVLLRVIRLVNRVSGIRQSLCYERT
jgi:hypothetical protein